MSEKKKVLKDQTGDVLRYEGLRITENEMRYLERLSKKISRWLKPGLRVFISCEKGEWIYRAIPKAFVEKDNGPSREAED